MIFHFLRTCFSSIGGFFSRSSTLFSAGVRDAKFREVLLWCLPALIVGFALRGWLTWCMPWGYFQFDSIDFVKTGARFMSVGEFVIPGKRSFLVPILYTIPFLLHIPALLIIPLAQHLLGLLQIVFIGIVVRLWFVRWRLAIIPATLWLAVCPWLLWFEHTLMSEALTFFFMVLDLCLGALWVKTRRNEYFVWLLISLLLTTGTRGEARFYFLFAILLPIALVGFKWKALKPLFLGIAGCLALTMVLCKTNTNAPAYLFASLVHLSPDHFKSVPGIEPYIMPVRDHYRPLWTQWPADTVKVAKLVSEATKSFLEAEHPHTDVNPLLGPTMNRMSLEILLRHPLIVLSYPIVKTHQAIDSWVSGKFDTRFLYDKQIYALDPKDNIRAALTKGLTGETLARAQIPPFIKTHYFPEKLRWFDKLGHFWNNCMIGLRLPDSEAKQPRWAHDFIEGIPGGDLRIPGWPLFYPISLIGIIVGIFFKHPQRGTIATWGITLLAVWYTAQMIGNATARYRFVYEPFLFLYILLLLDRVTMLLSPPTAQKSSAPPD